MFLRTCRSIREPGNQFFVTTSSIEETGFLEKKISLFSHTGTHVDAPAHLYSNRSTLDRLPLEMFYGAAVKLDFNRLDIETIDLPDLMSSREPIEKANFLLIQTGWNNYWGSDAYFSGYPALSREAAEWLVTCNLKGVGFDTISVDRADSVDFPVHSTLLSGDVLINQRRSGIGFETQFSNLKMIFT
jgi:arylformamidase